MSRTARIADSIAALPAADWSALDHEDNPFLAQPFLAALEQSGSVSADTGWTPHHLCLYEDERLVAAAPTYLKAHSHGEFVFDWAWADAYHRHGLPYYPKLLTAVPYSPVPGPRLLVRAGHPQAAELRRELTALACAEVERLHLSSWHCNFTRPLEGEALAAADLLERSDWQFHWCNRGYGSFADFLGTLRSRKRKNMRRDRRLVHDARIRFDWLEGSALGAEELDFVHACYQLTFLQHGNHPALTPAFFAALAADMPAAVLVVRASRMGRPIAMAFFLRGGGRLYGRYWGALEEVPGLHFETAYHQGIEYCIAHGLEAFEPGAQGEHKLSRGFEPVATHSFHLVRHAGFREAIARYLDREAQWKVEYRELLAGHDPFRDGEAP